MKLKLSYTVINKQHLTSKLNEISRRVTAGRKYCWPALEVYLKGRTKDNGNLHLERFPGKKKGNVFFVQRYFFLFKVALLVTDGKQTTLVDPGEKGPIQESKNMQARGIEVHAMGVGQVDPIDLFNYASDQSFILLVEDFTKLDAEVTKQANNLCPRKFQNLVRKIIKIRVIFRWLSETN